MSQVEGLNWIRTVRGADSKWGAGKQPIEAKLIACADAVLVLREYHRNTNSCFLRRGVRASYRASQSQRFGACRTRNRQLDLYLRLKRWAILQSNVSALKIDIANDRLFFEARARVA